MGFAVQGLDRAISASGANIAFQSLVPVHALRPSARAAATNAAQSVFDLAGHLVEIDWHPYVAAIIRVERNVFTRS